MSCAYSTHWTLSKDKYNGSYLYSPMRVHGTGTFIMLNLVGKDEEVRPPSRLSCRWKDIIKMYCDERGHEIVDWIYVWDLRFSQL
jgi:hypothetical protein